LGFQEEGNVFPVPGDHLKHRFFDLTKVEFWVFQDVENDILVPFNHLNRHFIDLKKVAFSVGQEAGK